MSNLTVDYTGEETPTMGLASTVQEAAAQIVNGYVPQNLRDLSTDSNFRDALVGRILRDTRDHDNVLEALCSKLRGSADGVDALVVTEYVAAIAYSWEHPTVALNAIARNRPTDTTKFIWAVAQAMYKKMPGPFFQTLLISETEQAEQRWLATR